MLPEVEARLKIDRVYTEMMDLTEISQECKVLPEVEAKLKQGRVYPERIDLSEMRILGDLKIRRSEHYSYFLKINAEITQQQEHFVEDLNR